MAGVGRRPLSLIVVVWLAVSGLSEKLHGTRVGFTPPVEGLEWSQETQLL